MRAVSCCCYAFSCNCTGLNALTIMVFNPFNTFRIFKCKLELTSCNKPSPTYYQAASCFSWFSTHFLILLSIPLSLKASSNSLSTGSHAASVFQWILQNEHELVQWTNELYREVLSRKLQLPTLTQWQTLSSPTGAEKWIPMNIHCAIARTCFTLSH